MFLAVTHRLDVFWTALDTFGGKRAKGHVSLLPGLVLLVVLAVHSAPYITLYMLCESDLLF